MKKAVIWLIVLVVVIGVVWYFAGRGKKAATKGELGSETNRPTGFMETTYDFLAKRLASLDDYGRQQNISRYYRYTLTGTGTITAVEPTDEGYNVQIDMDGDPSTVEVYAKVPAERVQTETPAAGMKVGFGGQIESIDYSENKLVVHLMLTGLVKPS